MQNKNPNKFVALLPIFLFGLIFLVDLLFKMVPILTQLDLLLRIFISIREILFAFAIWLLIPFIKKLKWIQSTDILTKMRALFFCIIATFIAFFIFPTANHESLNYFILLKPGQEHLLAAIAAFIFTFTGVNIVFLLRDLIYIRRKRTTQRNFSLLIFAMVIFGGYTLLRYYNVHPNVNSLTSLANTRTGGILLAVLIMLIVINSFRNSWINYLNKGQKVRYLFLSLFIVLSWPAVVAKLFDQQSIVYSSVFELFAMQVGLFLGVYWGMAFLAILFHLPTAGIVDRKIKEIQSLHALSRTISSEFNLNRLVVKISELSIEVTEANAAWLQIFDPQTGKLGLVAAKNLDQTSRHWIDSHPDQGIGDWVIKQKDVLWVNNLKKSSHQEFARHLGKNIESMMAVPVIFYDKILGVLCVLKVQEFGFIADDLNILRAFADQAAVALENARLVQANIEKERLALELKIAHEAQMKLLPKNMPYLEGLDIDAICITANDVGGDYFDFFRFSENRLGIVIGDVSGKGAEAAFYMAEVKGIIKSLAHTYVSPREVIIRTNDILFDSLERSYFISLIYAIIDLDNWQLTFSRAGHCPLLYGQPKLQDVQYVEPKGIGIGLTRSDLFSRSMEEKQLNLHDGDTLLFFTDGVVEAMNSKKEEFDEERLLKVFTKMIHLNSKGLKNHIVQEVRTFVGNAKTHDDLTMVVVKVNRPTQPMNIPAEVIIPDAVEPHTKQSASSSPNTA